MYAKSNFYEHQHSLSLSSRTTMETSSTILRSIEERIVVEENVITRENSVVEKVDRKENSRGKKCH